MCSHKNIKHGNWTDCYNTDFPYIVCLDCNNEVVGKSVEQEDSVWVKTIYILNPKGNSFMSIGDRSRHSYSGR